MRVKPGVFVGSVVHQRLRPKRHRLRYRAYWTLLDVGPDGLDTLGLRLLSWNRFNLFSFRSCDHGDGSDRPLRTQIEAHLAGAGIDLAGGRILMLAMPRVLGYSFNPLSVYFCYRADETLTAIVYEVHNTFQQRHCYVIPVTGPDSGLVRQAIGKTLYVSPFLPMKMQYGFIVRPPGDEIMVAVSGRDAEGPLINTALKGRYQPLGDGRLAALFFSLPLLTFKMIGAIHWEALRLWRKGIALVERPAPPARPATYGSAGGRTDAT